MYKRNLKNNYNKIQKFSIRKYSFGAASVAIASYLLFMGNGSVAANEVAIQENSTSVTKVNIDEISTKKEEKQLDDNKNSENENKQLTNVKEKLQNYIQEIESKLVQGVYSNKTEESIQLVRESLSLANNAKSSNTISEVESAYAQLITAVNTKLRNKAVEKKENPAKDTTEGKETVGIKAENTEKKSESNAIENTGAKDPRNGSEIQKDTTFRAAVNQDPKVEFNFSIPNEKKIYIYNEEHFSLEIPVYSETGKIRYATIKQGSRQKFNNVEGTANDLDIQYGFTATVINRDETAGVTSDASQANPAKIVITGRPNDVLKNMPQYTKQENQTLNVGTRYVQVVDDQGRENLKKGRDITDPGYFYLVLKSQAKKYALRSQGTDEKISVSSLTNPTAEDLKKIKDSIQLEYSTTNEDARFADKRGTLVEHPEDVIQSVNIVGNNIVVTFTDGSTKTKPVGEIVQKNTPPTVTVPYSDASNRNVYIYSGEETDLTFTANDESKIKDLKLRGPGDINYNNATNFGLAVGKVTDSALSSGEGSVSNDKKTATIKMTGTTNLTAGQKWTSIIVAKDDNSGESAPFDGRINATTNPAERQKIEGYVEFVVKNQTSKYDIKTPEGKVNVVDPSNPTTEEFEKIKEKVKIEYSQTNNDANFTSKSGQTVDNQGTKISTITKDTNGNLVVTYKDGSTDTKPLSEFTSLNKQPAIDEVKKAAEDKIAEINANTNATAEEKAAAIQKVNDDKTKALTAINDNSVTTKAALDNAKTSGTTAISNDNPVATKKDTAKAAIDTALREKEAAINANNALTTEEKNAAKSDAQTKATAAKTAIDNATTNTEVDTAETEGITSVASVIPTPIVKPAAKKAIEDALNAKVAQLDARNDLTTEEKEAAKADATSRANAAKAAIDNATTNATVDTAKTSGVSDVESVNPQASQKKTDAKNAVDEALKEKEAAIDANNDLTDEEKTAAKADAKAKTDAAKQAIDQATTNDAVTQAKIDGATSVDSVNPTAQAKPAAKKAIDDALKAKNDAIDANNDLTAEEKAKAKEDAKAKADAAKTAIDSATTNAGVEQAKNDGATEVNNVNPTPVAKPAAKKAIDDALKAKNDAIDANNDLTAEEKAKAKEDAKAKADAAKQAIDNATTNDAVTQAKIDGATSVDSVNPTAQAKPAAKKAIDDALKAKNDAIDANNDLTAEEKAKAKEDAKAKADAAKQAIDQATTNDAVTQAKTDGSTSVDSVNPTAQAKPAAKKAIDDALKAKNDAIDANNDLTAEEKAKAKEYAKAKADAAKQAIDQATTNDAVTQAKIDGATSVDSVNPTAQAKPAAKKAIDDALKAKNDAIDANNDLTAEEKAKAKEDAKAKADAAKQAIDNATTNDAVTQAKNDGAKSVDSVNPTAQVKPAAKQAIDDALKAKNDAIDVNNDLTAEEKAKAKEDAKAKADAAKQAIDNATTNAAVEQAKNDGTIEVNNVNPTPVAKPAAKKAVEDALADKIKEIEANNDLTAEEKAKAKEDAKAKADAAKQAIDNATTNAVVEQAKNDGTTEVNNVNPTPIAKPAAKQAIEDALKMKEAEIDDRDDLTAEEKTAAKEEAKVKADAAKQAVEKATTNADVENAKTTGVADVNSLNPVAVKKPEAKKAVDEALKAKEAEIDANNNLTAEEKLVAKEEAQAKADAAKQAIDGSDTDIKVDVNSISGLSDVNSFSPEPVKKSEAKKAIDAALEKKIEAIDARDDLTTEEKTAAKTEAENKANEAKEAIDAADTDIKVDVNSVSGLSDVNSFSPEAAKKPAAKQAIDDALKSKEDAIDSNDDLTAEEKAKAKAEAKAKADAAKEAIDNATTNAEVEQAKTAGTTSVDSVNPLAVKKPEAKKAIDDALKAKNDEIDARTDLTDEEKNAAKADAKKKANAAKEAIDNATTNTEVEQAKTAGTTKVDSVNPVAVKKPEAKKAIDDALKAKNDEIDARTDLTDEEKAKAKEEAKAKADAAKQAIDNSTTNAEVAQVKTNGTSEVASVNPQPEVKPEAKKVIDNALKAKNDEIDARTDLTDEEKAKAKEEAKAKVDAAKNSIDNATTNAAVEQAKANGTTEVNNVNPTAQAKPEAKQSIDEALKAKNDTIDARTDLTDEEKATAKEEVKKKADAAKQAIDNSTTNAEVAQAKTNGTSEVTSINPQPEAKTEAKKVIDNALKAKNDEIDARTDLTDEEKAKAKEEAKAKADSAKNAIDNATTNAAVEQAKANGTTEVNNVNPAAQAKPEAKQAIDEALKAKNDEIDARTDLTAEEKAKAKEEAKVKADAAKQAIDNATTNAEVEQAKTNGTTEVNNVNPTPVVKPVAKKAVDEALKAKEAEIDANNDLTAEEKAKAKKEAKAKADAAKEAIDKVTTNAEVEQAKANGTTEVKAVDPQPVAKTEAKKAIDDALKAKNAEIDARTDLTDEEKIAAKEEAKKKADVAKEVIDNATTNAAVEQAKATGATEVTSVNLEAVAKTAAKKAVDEALKDKNAEIDARADLTAEEKATAKADAKAKADAAKNAIDNATTNAAVEQAKVTGTTEITSVNPEAVAKEEAKKAVDEALKAKNAEIDTRTDLTDEEKATAKADVKAKADAAKDAIDNATTNVEVDQAKVNGTTEVTSVNSEAVAKTAAKKVVDEALKAKNDEIDARTDLTDEEKATAKAEAKTKADAAKEAIDKATTNAEVEQAKANGTTEVKAVDPQSVAKTAAKKAVDEALKAKNDEIDALTDLTGEEKATAKAEAKTKADAAKEAIDKATTNVKVDQAKSNGTTEVTSVNPEAVVKTAAKKAVDEDLNAKNAEIDVRADLTAEEKATAKADAKAKADAAKAAIDNATTNAEVNQVKANGTTEVISITPESVAKSAAKKVIDDALKAKNDEIDARTELTDEEKTAAKEDAKAKADTAKAAIDNATTNAEVDQAKTNGTTEVTSVNPEAVSKTEAKKAIENEAIAKKAAINARADLSEIAKEILKLQVDAIVAQAEKDIDFETKDGNVTNVTEKQKLAVKSVGEVIVPAEKLLVVNPTKLTEEEKAKVLELVKLVNPEATVRVDEKGNVTVTSKSGVSETITVEKLVKVSTGLDNINLTFEKQIVMDISRITKAEKANVKSKIMAKNPEIADVVFDEKGNATIILKDGQIFKVLAKDIFKPLEPSQEPSGVVSTSQTNVTVDKAQLETSILQLDSLVSQLNDEYKKEDSELLDAAKIVFNNPRATQEEVDAMVKRIAEFIAKVSTNSPQNTVDSEEKSNKETKAGATNVVGSSVGNTKQSSQKELPNTGTSTFGTILPAMAALLSGVGLFVKKKKEDE